jgi:thioredoxin reductase
MTYDVVIVGGGPGGLSAALALGRGRKRVLVADSGLRRNAAAVHMQNFVTRDGTSPSEFRAIAREQLRAYPSVEVRDVRVTAISGQRGAFRVSLFEQIVEARRVLLCTGMLDELLPLEGFRELWGSAIFQCPYCHGWEIRDQRWAYLAAEVDRLPFALLLRGWTKDVVVFTNGGLALPPDMQERLAAAGVRVDTRPIARLVARNERLEGIELVDGSLVECDALFAHPPQQQVELVRSLGVALDAHGFVQADATTRETSIPGVYAAGDLTGRQQAAILAAAAGTLAATMINHELSAELSDARVVGRARP